MDTTTPAASTRTASSRDWAFLILRLVLGITFLIHGAQLLFGAFGGPGLAGFTKMMGPVGYLVAIGEFFGGLGILVGFLSRFSAAAIIVIMLGAIVMVHLPNGFFMNWYGKQKGEGYEYHLLVIAICVAIFIAGPGRLTLGGLFPLPKRPETGNLIQGLE